MNSVSKPWLGAATGLIFKMPYHAFTAILGGLDLYFHPDSLGKIKRARWAYYLKESGLTREPSPSVQKT